LRSSHFSSPHHKTGAIGLASFKGLTNFEVASRDGRLPNDTQRRER
jgi:hypothetical protein